VEKNGAEKSSILRELFRRKKANNEQCNIKKFEKLYSTFDSSIICSTFLCTSLASARRLDFRYIWKRKENISKLYKRLKNAVVTQMDRVVETINLFACGKKYCIS
jgi:hypothetical protein